jgi:hypothetical protein
MKKNPNHKIRLRARSLLKGFWNEASLAGLIFASLLMITGYVTERFFLAGTTTQTASGILVLIIFILFIRLFKSGASWLFLKRIRRDDTPVKAMLYPFLHQPDRYLLAEMVRVALAVVSFLPLAAFVIGTDSKGMWYVSGTVLFLVTGVVLSFILTAPFALASFILSDHEEMNAQKALKASREKMRGRLVQYARLCVVFAGWAVLSLMSAGIGFIWTAPYIMMTESVFYDGIK